MTFIWTEKTDILQMERKLSLKNFGLVCLTKLRGTLPYSAYKRWSYSICGGIK